MLSKSHSQGNQKLLHCRSLLDRGSCSSFRICRSDIFPGRRFFRGLSDKLSKAICLKCSRSTTTAAASATGASGKFAAPIIDVHREEAIDDCIQFINHSSSSSSSLPRSNSVSQCNSSTNCYSVTRIQPS
ncbi:hypothetical protein LINGRAPRIM_LOCUS1598 [Linum grandiflorum]